MTVAYRITEELRAKFKEPFGELITGAASETMNKLGQILAEEKPVMLISVGDTVSRNMNQHNIEPKVAVVDFLCMRKTIEHFKTAAKKVVCVQNPPGTITLQAIEAIKEAVESKETVQVTVDGEEDLLTIIAVLHAPIGSLVVYGQPHEGIVLVRVSEDKKKQASKFLKAMEKVTKS